MTTCTLADALKPRTTRQNQLSIVDVRPVSDLPVVRAEDDDEEDDEETCPDCGELIDECICDDEDVSDSDLEEEDDFSEDEDDFSEDDEDFDDEDEDFGDDEFDDDIDEDDE